VLISPPDAESALNSIYAIRDEYRDKRAAALDQMEFNAQKKGNTADVSLYSTEAERHGAALSACNRILKVLSADTTTRRTPSATPFAPTENASVWPDGCAKRSSCARNRSCMYGCAAYRDKDIAADVDRAASAAPPPPSAWMPIAETDKHRSPLLIGWLDSAGVWQARRAWWDPEFATSDEWDERAGCYRSAGAWTDGAVADWVCEERASYDPTHVAALPAPPPVAEKAPEDAGGGR
jgi:hypothetical protein